MFKSIAAGAVALGLAVSPAAIAFAAEPAPAVQEAELTSQSSLNELMENEAARGVLEKHIPDVVTQIEPYIGQIPPEFTLASLAEFGLTIPAETLAAIDADLAAL